MLANQRTNLLLKIIALLSVTGLFFMAPPRSAEAVTVTYFDQIEKINQLGGTVFQVGGTGDGTQLLVEADFVGSGTAVTGVAVTLPGWYFASTVLDPDDLATELIEPGNFANVVLGSFTDLTFTKPGAGGPDADLLNTLGFDGAAEGGGDGSAKFVDPKFAIFGFGGAQTIDSFFVGTNTAGGGDGLFEFLDSNNNVIASITATLGPGAAESGFGGLLHDFNTQITFNGLRISSMNGSIEVDAVAIHPIPEPSTMLLLGSGLAGLGFFRRRRKQKA